MEARGAGTDVVERRVGFGRASESIIDGDPDEGDFGGGGVGWLDGDGLVDEMRACVCL